MTAFAGKAVWMTGAGTGIGKAGALMFAQEGAAVGLIGRLRDRLACFIHERAHRGSRWARNGL